MVNIKDLNKAEVLYALWKGSHTQGMSFLGMGTQPFTLEMAEELVKKSEGGRLYFDYVYGHVIKCDITEDEFNERLYDRDCGEGAAESAIAMLREGKLEEIGSGESYGLPTWMTMALIESLNASKREDNIDKE